MNQNVTHIKVILIFLSLSIISGCKNISTSNNSPNDIDKKIKLFEILMPDKTGINFENKLPESLTMNGLLYEYYYNGAGVAVADFNNDGLQDILFSLNSWE